MPIIFQQQLSAGAKLALWEITESLSFFEQHIDPVRHIAHEEVKKRDPKLAQDYERLHPEVLTQSV